MRSRAANSGMTLLEVMLAASIMAAVVALILTGYSRMAAAATVAKGYREGAELLELKLKEVYATDDLSTLETQGKFADETDVSTPLQDAAWRIDVTSKQTGLAGVKVTVTWQSNRGEETVSASTLKFLPDEITTQSGQSGQSVQQ
jgi:type II secretory pathway pseudopilin PulG